MTLENSSGQAEDLQQILGACLQRDDWPTAIQQQLAQLLLQDEPCSRAFGVTAENALAVVRQRSQLLQAIYPAFDSLCRQQFGWPSTRLSLLWRLWLPLSLQLAECRQQLDRPLIQGILGGQGTGKTTLGAILTLILGQLGYRVCCLSLDDLYKTYSDRQILQTNDPRLRWRGPPGTHDVDLGLTVLQQLRAASPSEPVWVPQFDKSAWSGAGDRTLPAPITGADIVLFEGWFVGARPIDPQRFDQAPDPINTEADRAFARDMNASLQAYVPLWDQLDRLLVLHPVDYRLSQAWRRQAEQQMKASGRAGMSDAEIDEFVEYFWRSLHPTLFIMPLLQDADRVDLVIEIEPDHSPGRVYRPAGQA